MPITPSSSSSSHSPPRPHNPSVYLEGENLEFDFWATAQTRSFQSGSPSHKRTVSSVSYLEAVVESKKAMMKMAGDMPDSCFELSLKDIVSENEGQRTKNEDDEEDVKNGSFHFATEDQTKKKRKKEKKKAKAESVVKHPLYGRVPRSRSLDKGAILIKVFNFSPGPFSWKSNRKTPSVSTNSPRNSLDGNGKKMQGKTGDQGKSSIHGSSSSISSSRSSSTGSSTGSSGCSSDSTTRLRKQRMPIAMFGCLTSFCMGTQKSKQQSRECIF